MSSLNPDLIKKYLSKNLLISPYISLEKINKITDQTQFQECVVITEEALTVLEGKGFNWEELEKAVVLQEKGTTTNIIQRFKELSSITKDNINKECPTDFQNNSVEIDFSYDRPSKKRTIQDFILHFNKRFQSMEKILKQRQELQNVLSIGRIISKRERENVSFIGMIQDISYTKNNNLIISIEDPTGVIKVIISKSKTELFEICKDLVLDEVIGVLGTFTNDVVFVSNIIWPDIPLTHDLKKGPNEVYSLFMSDTEFGCNLFLHDEFERFLQWINGNAGNEEQKMIAGKVKYIFIVGDLVNGVGIYPNQEKNLDIKDIYQQYELAASMLARIPNHIKIIICPGNHDAMRIAEPQPVFYKDMAAPLWNLPNVILVSNPSTITIEKTDSFSGFKILMYHGFSFIYYADQVESLRRGGGVQRSDLIKKFLLKRRHLAPTHTSNLYIPEVEFDPMVIETIPDFFVSGHVHTYCVSNYRGITLLNCSCWIGKTPYQEKFGIEPQPARVLAVNLQNRKIKVMKF